MAQDHAASISRDGNCRLYAAARESKSKMMGPPEWHRVLYDQCYGTPCAQGSAKHSVPAKNAPEDIHICKHACTKADVGCGFTVYM